MIKEQQKAEEIYQYARVLHGTVKAKEESINSAEATYTLIPFGENRLKKYWKKVVELLKKK